MSPYRVAPGAPAPDVLICSGLDPSGGAGFLADARVVAMLGGRPVGVISAMTVQNTLGLRSVHDVDVEVFAAQLGALLSDIEIRAVKIGMLGSADVIRTLDEALSLTRAPVIWDPIAAPSRGAPVLGRETLETALRVLGPHLALITPNVPELARLAGTEIRDLDEAIAAARLLAHAAQVAVFVKGGHLGTELSVDVLCQPGAGRDAITRFEGPRLGTEDVHGTGCALSSAIATYLALGAPLVEACRLAKQVVAEHIASPARPGRGAPAIV